MTDDEFSAIVKAAGLEATAAKYPADVRAALAQLARHRGQLPRTSNPALEPTPVFHAPAAPGARA